MNTPVYDFLQNYAQKDFLRLHMPGHKGRPFASPLASSYPYDITEIKGADSLFEADGILRESEENAAALFKTCRTLYSTQGSTLCIQTMLALAAKPGGTVVASRNAHRAFLNACVLLDLEVSWIYPQAAQGGGIVSCAYTLEELENAIRRVEKPSCVYITSPDYYGQMADVGGISALCRRYALPLLVDNAHGAHLAFLEKSLHPIALGADMCCDSAHKMLPVLTGGAYLHIGNERFSPQAKDSMALFASTSPSYLTLLSLDLCNRYLAESAHRDFKEAVFHINRLKQRLTERFHILESEPMRLTLNASSAGMTGTALADFLRGKRMECEYADERHIVLLFSSVNTQVDFEQVYEALMSLPKLPALPAKAEEIFEPAERALSIRAASLAENEEISVEESFGRICGKTRVPCPPGIPIAVAGERINKKCMNILKRYSISALNVVK